MNGDFQLILKVCILEKKKNLLSAIGFVNARRKVNTIGNFSYLLNIRNYLEIF